MGDDKALQLKVTLTGSKPPIWRRIRVSESMLLADLHTVIQIAMGWENDHLHEFEIKGIRYSEVDDDPESAVRDSGSSTLRDLKLRRKSQKFSYHYDFGDNWRHEVVVESVDPVDPSESLPVCLAGKRACPPEDCGGIYGYYRLLEVLSNPTHPEHDEVAEWVEESFDPSAFDIDAVNRALRRVVADA